LIQFRCPDYIEPYSAAKVLKNCTVLILRNISMYESFKGFFKPLVICRKSIPHLSMQNLGKTEFCCINLAMQSKYVLLTIFSMTSK